MLCTLKAVELNYFEIKKSWSDFYLNSPDEIQLKLGNPFQKQTIYNSTSSGKEKMLVWYYYNTGESNIIALTFDYRVKYESNKSTGSKLNLSGNYHLVTAELKPEFLHDHKVKHVKNISTKSNVLLTTKDLYQYNTRNTGPTFGGPPTTGPPVGMPPTIGPPFVGPPVFSPPIFPMLIFHAIMFLR
tara:strand:- start:1345 stop:1902 length:558 start_codon:yes stop_codon:yes gene_type:complete